MSVTRPVNLKKPFADTGSKNTIPVPSQIGITNGAASFTDGFPPLTTTPIAAGGVPPAGADMNGILNILSQHTLFANAGGKYRFDAALSTAIGGYPVGFVLQDNAGLNEYVNILAGNTTDFNSTPAAIGVSWILYAGTQVSSIAANGYQKLPSGLIVQWGSLSTSASVSTTATFPIAFPNAVFAVNGTWNGGGPAGYFVTCQSPSTTQFLADGWSNSTTRGSITVGWIALGY